MMRELARLIVENVEPTLDHIISHITIKMNEEKLDWIQALRLINEVERLSGVTIIPYAATTVTGAENR